MKKLLSILAAVGITASATTTVVACNTTKKSGYFREAYSVIPNAFSLKEEMKKDGVNVDDYNITFSAELEQATLRYMGLPTTQPFVTKTVKINPTTKDISKIITKRSLAISGFEKEKQNETDILRAINLLNQTNLTINEVIINLEKDSEGNINEVNLEAKNDSFEGEVKIINELMNWSDLIPFQNLGDIYISHKLIDLYNQKIIENPHKQNLYGISLIMPFVFEFAGTRNLLMEFFKKSMKTWGMSWYFSPDSIVTITFDNDYHGTFVLNPPINSSFNKEQIIIKFNALDDERDYVTSTHKPLEEFASAKENIVEEVLLKHYNNDNIEEIVGDLVTKYFGTDFANKYSSVLNEDFWITDLTATSVILTPKPGSMLFNNHDKDALTLVPKDLDDENLYMYKIEVKFGTAN